MLDNLTRVAIGSSFGEVHLISGDLIAGGKGINRKTYSVEQVSPVTNLYFSTYGRFVVIYYTTMKSIGSFVLKDKNTEHVILDDFDGCATNCADHSPITKEIFAGMAGLDAVT